MNSPLERNHRFLVDEHPGRAEPRRLCPPYSFALGHARPTVLPAACTRLCHYACRAMPLEGSPVGSLACPCQLVGRAVAGARRANALLAHLPVGLHSRGSPADPCRLAGRAGSRRHDIPASRVLGKADLHPTTRSE
jgi:hypothetical protein